MTIFRSQSLSAIVQAFFQKYLVGERDLSPNTVLSYRDALRLLLCFTSEKTGRAPDALTLEDFDSQRVRDFLDWIETQRSSSSSTRNQRLAALKTFFRYVASVAPDHLDRCRQIREIANRRCAPPAIAYLEAGEVQKLCDATGRDDRHGVRDRALLKLLFNTGARVQEIVDLNIADLRLSAPPKVRLRGKGRKQRDCPLWAQTVQLLRRWLDLRGLDEDSPEPLFVGAGGMRLSRSGIAYILRRAVVRAELQPKNIPNRHVTPHTLRHTTAMELLRSGVDITVIAAWLGHAQLGTTHQYVEIDLRMKQAAVAASTTFLPQPKPASYPDPSLLEWLDRLGRGQDYVQRSISKSLGAAPHR